MAKIRVLQSIAGDDFSWQPGQIVDLPADLAELWVDGVRAESVPSGSTPPGVQTPGRGGVETPESARPRRGRKVT